MCASFRRRKTHHQKHIIQIPWCFDRVHFMSLQVAAFCFSHLVNRIAGFYGRHFKLQTVCVHHHIRIRISTIFWIWLNFVCIIKTSNAYYEPGVQTVPNMCTMCECFLVLCIWLNHVQLNFFHIFFIFDAHRMNCGKHKISLCAGPLNAVWLLATGPMYVMLWWFLTMNYY